MFTSKGETVFTTKFMDILSIYNLFCENEYMKLIITLAFKLVLLISRVNTLLD